MDLECKFKKVNEKTKKGDDGERDQPTSSTSNTTYFEHITVCHNTAIATLTSIHETHSIARILAHEETGHWESYMRDRAVRKWCRSNGVQSRCALVLRLGLVMHDMGRGERRKVAA